MTTFLKKLFKKLITISSKIWLFLILTAIYLESNPIYSTVFARAGGGGSGGGGGGGSSGGGSSGSGNGGGFISFIFAIVIIIIVYIYDSIKKRYDDKHIQKLEKEIKIHSIQNPNRKYLEMEKQAEAIFSKFQQDWSNFNIESMKNYLEEQYFQKIELEMKVLQTQNRQNTVKNPKIINISVEEIINDPNHTEFTAIIQAQADDYLIDLVNHEILFSDHQPFNEYWQFIYQNNKWMLKTIRQGTENQLSTIKSIENFATKNNLFFDPDFGWLMIPNQGVIFKNSNFQQCDINNHVIGKYRDKIVEFYTLTPYKYSKTYLIAQAILPKSYRNILVHKKHLFNPIPANLQAIKTESNDFNKKFILFAHPEDDISSLELLTPNFMEKIYQLQFELNIEIVGNFLYFYTKSTNIEYDEMLKIISWAFDEMKQ